VALRTVGDEFFLNEDVKGGPSHGDGGVAQGRRSSFSFFDVERHHVRVEVWVRRPVHRIHAY
jgi:hypothetical protein